MPYVTCPDGKIYSRYDNSLYVQWCISVEDSINHAKFTERMKDPKWREEREARIEQGNLIIGFIIICAIVCSFLFIRFKSE